MSAANTPCKAASTATANDETGQSSEKPKMKQLEDEAAATGTAAVSQSSWEDFLGDPADEKSSIMIRFPDGQREAKNIPCSSTFMVNAKIDESYLSQFYKCFMFPGHNQVRDQPGLSPGKLRNRHQLPSANLD